VGNDSKIVFPIAFPNIITGFNIIDKVSGDGSILFTVAAYFLPLPTSIFDQAMALPYHLYVISTSGTDIEKSRAMAYGSTCIDHYCVNLQLIGECTS
jgi:phosphate transport system permease protein